MAKGRGGGRHWLAPILQNWATTLLQSVQLWTTQQLQLLAQTAQNQITAAQEQDHQELLAGLAQAEQLAQMWIHMAQQETEAREAQARLALEMRLMQVMRSEIRAAEGRIKAEIKHEMSQNTPGVPRREF